MSQDPIDATVAGMLGPSQKSLGLLQASLHGVSAEATAALRDLSSLSSALHDTAASAASRIRSLAGDDSLPADHRRRLAIETRETVDVAAGKMTEAAHAKIPLIEAAVSEALLPTPHRDPGLRLLIRDEVRMRFAGKSGVDLTSAIIAGLGNPSHDAEVLGEFGKAMMAGDPSQHKSVRLAAVAKYAQLPGGSERQKAAQKAYSVLRSTNLAGVVIAHREAGKLRLTSGGR